MGISFCDSFAGFLFGMGLDTWRESVKSNMSYWMRVRGNRKGRIEAFLFFIFCFVHLDVDGVRGIFFNFVVETITHGRIVLVSETCMKYVMG